VGTRPLYFWVNPDPEFATTVAAMLTVIVRISLAADFKVAARMHAMTNTVEQILCNASASVINWQDSNAPRQVSGYRRTFARGEAKLARLLVAPRRRSPPVSERFQAPGSDHPS
jgi:hypothetical protein